MAKAKHSFVDDYPYLVYSPDVEQYEYVEFISYPSSEE